MEWELINGDAQNEAIDLTSKLRPEVGRLNFATIGGTLLHELAVCEVYLREAARNMETRKMRDDSISSERKTPPPVLGHDLLERLL